MYVISVYYIVNAYLKYILPFERYNYGTTIFAEELRWSLKFAVERRASGKIWLMT